MFLYDTEADRSRAKTFLYAVGALYSTAQRTGEDAGKWHQDGPRWFVEAKSPLFAIATILEKHAVEIASRSCRATVERPQLGDERMENGLWHADGSARILWVANIEDAFGGPLYRDPKDLPERAYPMDVTLAGIPQRLSFRYVRLS